MMALYRATKLGIKRVFIINHDKAESFEAQFNDDGLSKFHGSGELIVVKDGVPIAFSGCVKGKETNDWLDANARI